MAVFRVDLTTGDPAPLFAWLDANVPSERVVRKSAQRCCMTVVFARQDDATAFRRLFCPERGDTPVPAWGSHIPELHRNPRSEPDTRPRSLPKLANLVLRATDKKLLTEILFLPWPGAASGPEAVNGDETSAYDRLCSSYLPLEEMLRAAAELADEQIAAGAYRDVASLPEVAHLSDTQLREYALDAALFDGRWDIVGVARRFLLDDPAELARFTAVSLRLCSRVQQEVVIQWGSVLSALALGEEPALNRLVTALPYPLADVDTYPFPAYYLHLYNAVLGVWHRDTPGVVRALDEVSRRRLPAADAAMATCLRGIAAHSAELVAEGLAARGPATRRIRAIDPHFKLLDVDLHGLYELGRHIDPDLTRLWDTSSRLPWDADFHAWRRSGRHPLDGVDLSRLPERYRRRLTAEIPGFHR